MDQEFRPHKAEGIFSKKLRAGKRRTYFFDIRATRSNDYYLTITESKKKLNEDGYERHKVFLYKEDFNKFIAALNETIDYVKTELMPEYDFDEFARKQEERRKEWEAKRQQERTAAEQTPVPEPEAHSTEPATDALSDLESSSDTEEKTEVPAETGADNVKNDEDLSW